MCGIPCGPRTSGRSTSNSKPSINTKISKSETWKVINYLPCEISYKKASDEAFQTYEGCTNNLYMILYEMGTKVKVAGRRSEHFQEGYRTIIMDAPCFPATVLIKYKEEGIYGGD